MTTQLVRDTMKLAQTQDIDLTELFWFDASGCIKDGDDEPQSLLKEYRPPFPKCMVCYEGTSTNFQKMRMWMLVAGQDPEEGIVLSVWRQPLGYVPVPSVSMFYIVNGDEVGYGPIDENVKIDKEEAEMILGFVSAWYRSMATKKEAYVPVVAETFTNRRKIAQGKAPSYDWSTVTIDSSITRSNSKGGTHASPRLHDRRGHLRRLKSGKNVWVRPCKVGDPSLGTIFHDYKIGKDHGNS